MKRRALLALLAIVILSSTLHTQQTGKIRKFGGRDK